MSDFEESDTEFENFRLVSPNNSTENEGFSNTPLKNNQKEFEAKFSGSFLEDNLFGNAAKTGGFGSNFSADGDGKSEKSPEKEENVGLDWDASTIFKNLACPENNHENSVCVLRLHDILTKSEMGVQKITRQMIDCGRLLNGYHPQTRRDLGFEDGQNIKNLLQMIRSLRANTELMMIETEDLQELIHPESHEKDGSGEKKKPRFSTTFLISAGVITSVPIAIYFNRNPPAWASRLWLSINIVSTVDSYLSYLPEWMYSQNSA